MINNPNSLIGKYVHIVHATDYPIFLFNVQKICPSSTKGYQTFVAEQVLDSPNSDDLEVYCEGEWEIDIKNDVVIGVYDTAEELFEAVSRFLKDQIERCSGIQIK